MLGVSENGVFFQETPPLKWPWYIWHDDKQSDFCGAQFSKQAHIAK